MMMLSILKFQFLHFAILLTCSKTFHHKIQLIINISEHDVQPIIYLIVSLFIHVINLLSIHIRSKVPHLWNEKYVYQVCFYMSDFYTYHLPHVETLSNHPRRCDVPKSNKQRRAQERRNISGYPTY